MEGRMRTWGRDHGGSHGKEGLATREEGRESVEGGGVQLPKGGQLQPPERKRCRFRLFLSFRVFVCLYFFDPFILVQTSLFIEFFPSQNFKSSLKLASLF